MSPLAAWPAALGFSFLAAGFYMYRAEIFGPTSTGGSRVLSLAPVFMAAPLAAFSGEHFTAARGLANAVPKWMPWHVPIAYFVGCALVAAALSFVARRCIRWSGPLLALMFALFVLTLHLPNAIAHAGRRIFWVFPFRESQFALGALSIFVYAQQGASPAERSGKFALFAKLWTALVVIYFGTQNLLYPQYTPGVPDEITTSAWVPAPHLLSYLTGTILVTLGIAMLFRKTAVAATTYVGILMTVLAVALFGPDLFLAHTVQSRVQAINFVFDTLLFAGAMFAVARVIPAPVSRQIEQTQAPVVAGGAVA